MKSVFVVALFALFALSQAVPIGIGLGGIGLGGIGLHGGYGGIGLGLGGLSYTQRIQGYTPYGVIGNAYGGIGIYG